MEHNLKMFQNRFKNLKSFYKLNKRFTSTWFIPKGYETEINIYNCITKKKEPLIVTNRNAVSWYTCGPTVYDSAHIGHASSYVKLDIIQRILKKHFGLNLVTCMNITDLDDKIINKSLATGIDYREIAQKYEKEFWTDLNCLGIQKPNIILRVTENIPLIINFIKKLESKDLTYKTKDNSVYFKNINKSYGKLQNIGESQHELKDVDSGKLAPKDFALWKGIKFENEPSFNSPWGAGRPAWHIECSALATKAFGSTIDLHAGGIDLRFPHHENEEAQSCAYHSHMQWVNYWVHTGHLHLINDQKMSKSLRNTISIQNLLNNGPGTTKEIFRLLCAMSRYRTSIEFSDNLLQVASRLMTSFKHFLGACKDVENGIIKPIINELVLRQLIEKCQIDIHHALCDDFNTPAVIEIIIENITKVNSIISSTASNNNNNNDHKENSLQYILAFRNLFYYVMDLFGVDLITSENIMMKQNNFDDTYIDLLVKFRQEVRNLGLETKNADLLKLCDKVRDDLHKIGIVLKDHGKVTSWTQ